MAGKIILLIEKGKAKRPDLSYYPYWSLEIIPRDKNEQKIIVTPTYEEWKQLLHDILIHEFRVDAITNRKSEFVKYREFFKSIWAEASQKKLGDFDLPDIYKNCKKKED